MSTSSISVDRPVTRDGRLTVTLWPGLALTVVATVVPFVDAGTTHVLADHVRAGYPAYSAHEIDAAVTAYLAILATAGVLGTAGWLVTIRGARRERRWVPWLATALLVLGAGLALTGLTVTDTSGDVGLAPAVAWFQVLPCLAGLGAVVLLWRRR
ncbi:hypothetical protein GCM10025864_13900 [Luteimicrobium album]|uniref:DUF998 domain-containing protein n=1 Tax=Luteimicrobium album TaxID=1054550 RepID=A0ABQ6HYU2_9MICO|nr:hypothetical protein [Luteimicrobium album]GMA23631.1 hypothetical protein GCM10025864_13900 [Luteimicrobium album]